jgi:tetratricopeptide (TPR) repeat protein
LFFSALFCLQLLFFPGPLDLPEDPILINNEAVKLIQEGRFDPAIRKLTFALSLDPNAAVIRDNLAAAYAQRGMAAGKKGKFYAAIEDLRTARKHAPANVQYGYFLASFYYRTGALERAEDLVDQVLKQENLGEREAGLKKLKGSILYLDERLKEALIWFKSSLDLDPNNEDALRTKSKIERELAIHKEYREDTTTYFRLIYDDETLDLSSSGPLVCALEEERSKVCSDLNHFPRHRVTVILYSPADFKSVTESERWVGGLFDRKIRIPVSDPSRVSETVGQIIRHEYTHVILYELAPWCPTWINEGIACFEQYGRGQGRKKMLTLIQEGSKPIPFDRLPSSFFQTSDPDLVRLYYVQSHAMMEYLIDHYGMGRIRLFLRELNKEGDWEKAFRSALGRDFKDLERDWIRRFQIR